MRKRLYLIYIIAAIAIVQFTSCSKEEESQDVAVTELTVRGAAHRTAILLRGEGSWQCESDVDWITPEQRYGDGSNDTLYVSLTANPTVNMRQGTLTISYDTPGVATQIVHISQQEGTLLMGKPGIEKAAGYSYDVTASYLEGMRYQVFDITYMDYQQIAKHTRYVEDDNELQSMEEVVTGKTEEAISEQISANASVGLDMLVFKAELTGSAQYTRLEEEKTAFAMKRAKRLTYTRDIHYANVLADVLNGDTRLFTAGFYADWKALQEMNNTEGTPSASRLKAFIEKWGKAFVARACLGGTIDMEIEIEEKVLKESLTIEVALNASLAGVINGEAGGEYKEVQQKIQGHYRRYVHVRGGEAQAISILNSGGNISYDQYQTWLKSINNSDDPSASKVALVDLKLVSMAELFTGKVKKALDEIINK